MVFLIFAYSNVFKTTNGVCILCSRKISLVLNIKVFVPVIPPCIAKRRQRKIYGDICIIKIVYKITFYTTNKDIK